MGENGLVVGAAIVRDARVLAARRAHPPELAGRWELPGGAVEPGEDEVAALARECREELALAVEVGGRLGPDVALPGGRVLRVRRCACTDPVAEPEAREHGALRWVGADELDDLDWLDADRVLLGWVREALAGVSVRGALSLRPLTEHDVPTLDVAASRDPSGSARLGMPAGTWWRLVRDDPDRHGWIVLLDGVEVGYLDAEEGEGHVHVAVLLFPEQRGAGLIAEVVRHALAEPVFRTSRPVIAGVEADNLAARRAATRAGFDEVGLGPDGIVTYRLAAPAG